MIRLQLMVVNIGVDLDLLLTITITSTYVANLEVNTFHLARICQSFTFHKKDCIRTRNTKETKDCTAITTTQKIAITMDPDHAPFYDLNPSYKTTSREIQSAWPTF